MLKFFPISLMELIYTEKCNLNCSYCFEKEKRNRQMTIEDMKLIAENNRGVEFYSFGGEPMMSLELITTLFDEVEKQSIPELKKKFMLESILFQITNATLIEKHLDTIKKYKLKVQVSIDGVKELHDKNRKYSDGRGSFDEVMKSIDLLLENKFEIQFHGVIGKDGLCYLFDSFKFFWELQKKLDLDLNSVIKKMGSNIQQVMFEDDYTDNDIDLLIDQNIKIAEFIMSIDISDKQKKDLMTSWFKKRGSSCIAGNRMLAIDPDFNVYPCHRLVVVSDRDKYSLLNLKEERKFRNIKLFNNFLYIWRKNCMFSSNVQNINWKDNLYWMNWCPSTNIETSESIMYQSAKYNLMIAEFNRFVVDLFAHFKLE